MNKLLLIFTITSVYYQSRLFSPDQYVFVGKTQENTRITGQVEFPIAMGDKLEQIICTNGNFSAIYYGLPGFANKAHCSGIFLMDNK